MEDNPDLSEEEQWEKSIEAKILASTDAESFRNTIWKT